MADETKKTPQAEAELAPEDLDQAVGAGSGAIGSRDALTAKEKGAKIAQEPGAAFKREEMHKRSGA